MILRVFQLEKAQKSWTLPGQQCSVSLWRLLKAIYQIMWDIDPARFWNGRECWQTQRSLKICQLVLISWKDTNAWEKALEMLINTVFFFPYTFCDRFTYNVTAFVWFLPPSECLSPGGEFCLPGPWLSHTDHPRVQPHKPALQHQTRHRGQTVERCALRDPWTPPKQDVQDHLPTTNHDCWWKETPGRGALTF